ncbi:MAG: CfrBI family restriction endonuclease [Armatimonadetes bacterium]|nr:CfrBI family restriction endonuclease [Armatimonadota bacterium]
MGIVSDFEEKRIALGWRDLVRLTTAIGSQTLAIRGSDKSMFGNLFEKLILGSTLTILGFRRVNPATNRITDRVFWLSDARGNRESDAALIYRSGKLARFDIGFIGRGNPEISKDKLSRYEREAEIMGGRHQSVTFILVDRLPANSMKTQEAAQRIGAEIIQMHWQYWPRDLARRLGERFEYIHPIQLMSDQELDHFLSAQLEQVRIQDFLSAVTLEELESEASDGGTPSEDPNI